jgi:hypothetical protein
VSVPLHWPLTLATWQRQVSARSRPPTAVQRASQWSGEICLLEPWEAAARAAALACTWEIVAAGGLVCVVVVTVGVVVVGVVAVGVDEGVVAVALEPPALEPPPPPQPPSASASAAQPQAISVPVRIGRAV